MPSPKPHRNGTTERSRSFNGRGGVTAESELRRPRTVPDLRSAAAAEGVGGGNLVTKKVLTKVLMNVSIQGSVGPVQVLVNLENTVGELILAVVKQYIKEGRRCPLVLVKDAVDFDLHYSQFTLECLDREEKLATLGSRNFFMCKRRKDVVADGGTVTTSSCSSQAEKVAKLGSSSPWFKFMSFLLK